MIESTIYEDDSSRIRSSSITSSSTNNNDGKLTSTNFVERSTTTEDLVVESIYKILMETMCRDVAVGMHKLIKTGADDMVPSSWKLFSGTKVPTRRELYPELYNSNESATSSNSNNSDEEKDRIAGSGEGDDAKTNQGSVSSTKGMTDEEIKEVLDKYAVDLPSSSFLPASRKRRTRGIAEEEEKRRLLSKIRKEKENNYKDSDDEDDEETNTNDDEDEDEDDEDFKMDDEDDDDEKKTRKGRSLSSSSINDVPVASLPTSEGAPESTTTKNTLTQLDIWGKMPAKEPKNRLCRCRLCGRLISTSRFASHLDKCMGLSTSRGGGGGASSSSSSMILSGKSTIISPMGVGSSGGLVTKKVKRG